MTFAKTVFSLSILSSGFVMADETLLQTTTAVAYDADLFNKDKRVFFASGEFLYWLANESALQYAVKMNSQPWSQTEAITATGKYQNSDFHWAPGGRVSFGYFNAPHFWDVFAQYTYLSSSGHSTTDAPEESGEYLVGTWPAPKVNTETPAAPLSHASSHINLHYNVCDFLCSRRFIPNEHFRLNLFGGVTAALMHQHWSIHYTDTSGISSLVRNRWRFDGLGIRSGMKLDWYMGSPDLYLTGSASGALLSGWYKNVAKQKSSLGIAAVDPSTPVGHTVYEDHRLVATTQIFFGPSWQKRFTSVRTELVAGYEFTVWNNLQEVYRSNTSVATDSKTPWINTSLLTLQGLTVRFTLDF